MKIEGVYLFNFKILIFIIYLLIYLIHIFWKMTSVNNYLKGLNVYRNEETFITIESNFSSDAQSKSLFKFSLL